MVNASELKTEIEEIRCLLYAIISEKELYDCNSRVLLDISTRMDELILEYMKMRWINFVL